MLFFFYDINLSARYKSNILLVTIVQKQCFSQLEEFTPWGQGRTKKRPGMYWMEVFTLEEACTSLDFPDWSFSHTTGERSATLGISHNNWIWKICKRSRGPAILFQAHLGNTSFKLVQEAIKFLPRWRRLTFSFYPYGFICLACA